MRYLCGAKTALLLVGIVTIGLTSCDSGNKELPEVGIPYTLAEQRKDNISDIVYELFFDIPDEKNEPINAELQLGFEQKKSDQDLILDFNADKNRVKEITIGGKPVAYKVENEHIIISANELILGRNEVKLAFVAGDQSLNRQEDYLYTLFVPDRASTCFPVFDQPNLKAIYKLSLKIPSHWTAVANGALISKKEEKEKTTYKFKETLPISSYLFAFSAGEFQVETKEIEGREMNMYHRESDTLKVRRNLDDIFEWHVKSLQWLEAYTDREYPFPKFDFVLIPSFQYGGMEHPGAIFYKASSLFLDESATLNQQIGRGRLIAHETAHMWFGNLVTMDWFNDVWLKEVFANFMAAKIVNPEFADINHDLQFLFGHYPRAYAVDRTKGTHAIQQKLDNLKNAGSLYGSIIYQKAPIVMRMLEDNMGKEAFRDGIREYIESYPFDNATWDDLVSIMSQHTDYQLDQWNEQWVKSPGMPMINYTIKDESNGATKALELHVMGQGESKGVWPQDIEIATGTTSELFTKTAPLLTSDLSLEVNIDSLSEFIFTNALGVGYGYFEMDDKSIDHFLKHVDDYDSALFRAAVWVNLFESTVRGDIPAEKTMKTAMTSLAREQETLILSYISQSIRTIFWNFYNDEQRNQVASKLEGVLLNMMLSSDSKSLKATFFNTLMAITTSPKGTELLRSIWLSELSVEGLTFSETDYTRLAYELAVREVENYENILEKQLENIKNVDRKKRMEYVLPALSSDDKVRNEFFESLKDPVNRENEEWVLEGLRYLHHPLRTKTSYRFIRPSLELLEEIKQTGDIFFPKRWLDNTLSNHQLPAARDSVVQFLNDNNTYPQDLKNKILQSADMLIRSVEINEKDQSTQNKKIK